MYLNTYESAAIPDVFVTLPSVEARSIIALVEKLAALRLSLVRSGYTLSVDSRDVRFLQFVSWEIVAQGYAIHGFDPAFDPMSAAQAG